MSTLKEKKVSVKNQKKNVAIGDLFNMVKNGELTYGELRTNISKITKNKEEANQLIRQHSDLREPYFKAVQAFIFSDETVLNSVIKV